jgi:hypothetical protein
MQLHIRFPEGLENTSFKSSTVTLNLKAILSHDDILQIFHMRNQSLELHLHFLRLNAILSLSLLISKLSTLEN